MELKHNQAALILETSEEGEVTVDVASPDQHGLAGALCQAIAIKIMEDEQFQAELMEMLNDEGE